QEQAGDELRECTVHHCGIDESLARPDRLHLNEKTAEERGETDEVEDDEKRVKEVHGPILPFRRGRAKPRLGSPPPGLPAPGWVTGSWAARTPTPNRRRARQRLALRGP